MATKVRLENRSAHLKYITIGGGQSIAVPPQEQGGIDLTFDSEAELAAFKRALETQTVRDWIASGELVVVQDGASQAKPATSGVPAARDPEHDVSTSKRGRGREGE